MKKFIFIGLLVMNTIVMAGQVGTLHSFVPKTPAKASEVNDNFDAVKNAVNDNASTISQHATVINSNTALINQVFGESIGILRTINFTSSSDFNPSSSFTSQIATASCLTNEVLVGGSCSCVTSGTDLATTNYGLVIACEAVGNSYAGFCTTPFSDVDVLKFGSSINVHAICLKAIKVNGDEFQTLSAEERKPDTEAQDRIDQLNELRSMYESISISKATGQ